MPDFAGSVQKFVVHGKSVPMFSRPTSLSENFECNDLENFSFGDGFFPGSMRWHFQRPCTSIDAQPKRLFRANSTSGLYR
jgi:hypothetical protein